MLLFRILPNGINHGQSMHKLPANCNISWGMTLYIRGAAVLSILPNQNSVQSMERFLSGVNNDGQFLQARSNVGLLFGH